MKNKNVITMQEEVIPRVRLVNVFSKVTWILFIIAAVCIMLDGYITTPIALATGATEMNIWHNHFYQAFGVNYFYWFTPFSVILLFFLTLGIDIIAFTLYWNHTSDKQVSNVYSWVTWIFLCFVILVFSATVINNVGVIINGI